MECESLTCPTLLLAGAPTVTWLLFINVWRIGRPVRIKVEDYWSQALNCVSSLQSTFSFCIYWKWLGARFLDYFLLLSGCWTAYQETERLLLSHCSALLTSVFGLMPSRRGSVQVEECKNLPSGLLFIWTGLYILLTCRNGGKDTEFWGKQENLKEQDVQLTQFTLPGSVDNGGGRQPDAGRLFET